MYFNIRTLKIKRSDENGKAASEFRWFVYAVLGFGFLIMKFRKTIEVSFRVQVPGFKATRKYRLASAVCVISDQCDFWDDYGIAIAIEPSGRVHIITHGVKLTKRQIQEEYGRGGKFICIGLRSLNGKKEEPIYEMIVGE